MVQLAPPPAPSQSTTAVPPVPAMLAALEEVRAHLSRFDAPPTMRSALLRRLLVLLIADIDASKSVATTNMVHSKSGTLPQTAPSALDSHVVDELLGECVASLMCPSDPPIDCLPLLEHALPRAFTRSTAPALHAAVCALLRTMPIDAIDKLLQPLEPLLAHAQHRTVLVPCFAHALALHPFAEAERPDLEPNRWGGGGEVGEGEVGGREGGSGEGGGHEHKRICVRAPSLRQRLLERAISL